MAFFRNFSPTAHQYIAGPNLATGQPDCLIHITIWGKISIWLTEAGRPFADCWV